ncbi:hypothetical protein DKP78_24155, partial [Enterococcus faecium]
LVDAVDGAVRWSLEGVLALHGLLHHPTTARAPQRPAQGAPQGGQCGGPDLGGRGAGGLRDAVAGIEGMLLLRLEAAVAVV